ncbi:MAG: hypothetical protein AAF456_15755 [Planctomycetota bacterium]
MKLSLPVLALMVLVSADVATAPQQKTPRQSSKATAGPAKAESDSVGESEPSDSDAFEMQAEAVQADVALIGAAQQDAVQDRAEPDHAEPDHAEPESAEADNVEQVNIEQDAPNSEDVVPEQDRKKVDYPESDLFLFELSLDGIETSVSEGRNVTARTGYENQPFFRADSRSFVFSQSDEYQTDVFEYFIESGETRQLTRSANMEFSPQPSPDNTTISFVTDGEGANQSVWHVSTQRDAVQWTLEHLPEREPVGYYVWNHDTGYILYWSRYGFSMRLTHESEPLFHYVTGDAVPTTPRMIPETSKFSFVHRQGNSQVWIKELDPETLAIRPLTPVAGTNTHYDWAPDGSIMMMQGTMLFRWKENESEGWQEVADLADAGMQSATRVGISPDGSKLAVVGVPVPEDEPSEDE